MNLPISSNRSRGISRGIGTRYVAVWSTVLLVVVGIVPPLIEFWRCHEFCHDDGHNIHNKTTAATRNQATIKSESLDEKKSEFQTNVSSMSSPSPSYNKNNNNHHFDKAANIISSRTELSDLTLAQMYKKKYHRLEAKYRGPFYTINNLEDEQMLPPSGFHGCNDRGLCKFSNVCVSGANGILVFSNNNSKSESSGRATDLDWVDTYFVHQDDHLEQQEDHPFQNHYPSDESHAPRIVDTSMIERVHFVDSMFLTNCLHQGTLSRNPAHFLYGIGKLFLAASGYYNFEHSDPTTTHFVIVYQQCMNVDDWPWGSWVEKLVWDFAYSKSFVGVPWKDREYQRIILPVRHEVPQPNDIVICGGEVQSDIRLSASHGFLGTSTEQTVKEWSQYIEKVVFQSTADDLNEERERQRAACDQRSLRIASWRRTDDTVSDRVTHLRLFRNMDEIHSLVSEFTTQPLRIVSATVDTPPMRQASLFRSFDILISPFGAHLTNMVFGRPNHTVYIEVAPVNMGSAYTINSAFSKRYIASHGHMTWNNPELETLRPNCTKEYSTICWDAFRYTDIIVNVTLLRTALEEAVETICFKPN